MSEVKYVDYTGLLLYHKLNIATMEKKDAAIETALLAQIDAIVGEGEGSIADQIEDAIESITGTLDQGDATTLAAINDELDGIDSAIATLNGDNTTAGSVAKAVKDGIDALDGGTISLTSKQAVTSVSLANGLVSASTGNIDAQYVEVNWGSTDPVSSTANVQASLDEIYGKIADNAEAGEVAVYKTIEGTPTKVNSIAADGNTYTLKQGTQTVATINIARDMVVSSGSVITATGNETDVPTGTTLTPNQKYVRLVIANSTDGKNIYIAVNDLYDDYSFTDSSEIDFTETNNDVTASIKTGSIAESKLDTALQTKIAAAATTVNEKTTGHVTVTVTPASGANPAQVTVSESDIASANDLSSEVTRAQSAETAIDTAVGLTKANGAETRSITPTTNYGTGSTTVMGNMQALDTALKAVSDSVSVTITLQEIEGLFSAELTQAEIAAAEA